MTSWNKIQERAIYCTLLGILHSCDFWTYKAFSKNDNTQFDQRGFHLELLQSNIVLELL